MSMLTFVEVQKILNAPQKSFKKSCDLAEFSPTDAHGVYSLEDLCLINQVPQRLQCCFSGEPVIRDWRSQRKFPSLDAALAGGCKAWALNAYRICDKGLVLDFLPRTDSRLMSQADSASGKLTELCQEEYWVAATEEANWLYDRYGYRVLVAGKFQAWLRHRRSGRSDVVVSNGRTIWMMVVENHRKVEKVVYSFGAGDRICREMYA